MDDRLTELLRRLPDIRRHVKNGFNRHEIPAAEETATALLELVDLLLIEQAPEMLIDLRDTLSQINQLKQQIKDNNDGR